MQQGFLRLAWQLLYHQQAFADIHLWRALEWHHVMNDSTASRDTSMSIACRLLRLPDLTLAQLQLIGLGADHGGLGVPNPKLFAAIHVCSAVLQQRRMVEDDAPWSPKEIACHEYLLKWGVDVAETLGTTMEVLRQRGYVRGSKQLLEKANQTVMAQLEETGWVNPTAPLQAPTYTHHAATMAMAVFTAPLALNNCVDFVLPDPAFVLHARVVLQLPLVDDNVSCAYIMKGAYRQCGKPLDAQCLHAAACCRTAVGVGIPH